MANPTVLEKAGAFMIGPIYDLLFCENGRGLANGRGWIKTLELAENETVIYYKTYKTDDPDNMQAIIDQNLAPGTVQFLTPKVSNKADILVRSKF